MQQILVLMFIVIGAATLAGEDRSEPSTKTQTFSPTQPIAEGGNTAAATLAFLGFRLWMSAAEARAQVATGEFLVIGDTAGSVQATGEYAGHQARYEWNFTRSGNLRSFVIILDYGGAEAPADSPFHPAVKRALDDQRPSVRVGKESCQWEVGDERVILSVNRNWPKGARAPRYEWHIDMVSQVEEPDPDPAVVLNQRLSAAGSTAEKWLEVAGIEAPVSPTQCLDRLAKSAPEHAIAVAECLEQACERQDVAAILSCLADCPAAAPGEPGAPAKPGREPQMPK